MADLRNLTKRYVMEFKLNQIPVLKLANFYKKDKFVYNPDYQRSEVWDKKNKQKLIDSILRGYSIGIMFFKERKDKKIEVLDGQQRIKTIGEFVCGGLETSRVYTKDFYRKRFSDLKNDFNRYSNFKKYKVYYFLVDAADQVISDIFIRLQEGKPLNSAEKLNALRGEMRDFVYKISQHGLFTKVQIPKNRFAVRFICAQLAYLEKESRPDDLFFPRPSYTNLKKFYDLYEAELPKVGRKKINSTVSSILDFLYKSLKKDARVIQTSSDFLTIYLLASNLVQRYVTKSKERNFRDFIINFYSRVAEARTGELLDSNDPVYRYALAIGTGLTSENLKTRYEIVSSEFFSKIPKLVKKDPKEEFDINQKLAIYYNKDKRVCGFCKNQVAWEDKSFHHIKFRSLGGPTIIDNGQLMHKKCHEEFHEKKGKDVEIY